MKKKWYIIAVAICCAIVLVMFWPRNLDVNKSFSGYIIDIRDSENYYVSTLNLYGELTSYSPTGGDLSVTLLFENLPADVKAPPEKSHYKLKNKLSHTSVTKISSNDSLSFFTNKDLKQVLIEFETKNSDELRYVFVGPATTIEEAYIIARNLSKNDPIYMQK